MSLLVESLRARKLPSLVQVGFPRIILGHAEAVFFLIQPFVPYGVHNNGNAYFNLYTTLDFRIVFRN